MTDGSETEQSIGVVRTMDINDEMRGSYLDYAMSVIVARALPDARDGMKPVHRRILYAMHDMGVRPNTAYKKSARIVGEVLGKYHPHGDSAVYDAMARMAQNFSLRYMLVDGQGNFGSIDGDSPAAMRYTEARMARVAEEMLADINMDTVDFQDNYDGTQQEPVVLPARLPNMLLNGASGIAVGMATSIPPHNLREIVNALIYLIDHYEHLEDVTVDDLMQFVSGPDFPTGAQIIANEELKEAYATGKGRVVVRGKADIEEGTNGLRLVFTSIPYQVSKVAIIERIVGLVRSGRLEGIRDLRDESDRDGLRLVVELKRGTTPQTILNRLYKYTQLQSTFSIQMLALVKSEPRTLSLKRALSIFLDHRYEVIVRRSEFELGKRRARAHILEGLLKALSSLDQIIQTIRASPDAETARIQLMTRFDLTEAQAEAILEMQLRRLAALERQRLQTEYDEVLARITFLEDLLNSPAKIRAVIRDDLTDITEQYGDERNTELIYGDADFNEDDLVRDEDVVIMLTDSGYIKRVPSSEYRAQRRGGKGMRGMATREEDILKDIFFSSSKDTVLFFSDKGKVYSQKAYRIPEAGRANRGTLIHTVLPLEQDEHITAILPVTSFDQVGWHFVMVTKHGRIKRVHLQDFADVRPSGLIAMSLNEGDYLGWVKYSNGDQHIVVGTEQGQSIRFHERQVRVMGRTAGGVNAIKLSEGDLCAGMDVIDEDKTHIIVVTSRGFGKRTAIEQYTVQSRYGSGLRTLARNDRTGPIVGLRAISETDEIMLITRGGTVLRTGLDHIRETGRSTQGVKLMNVSEEDEVVGMAVLRERELADNTLDDANGTGAGSSPAAESNGAPPEEDLID
ncbi:MAG: DNA gyrase subunit A [Anaerolineaceae bacterium]|nr:MAG: DNA gyrase subunit A [Anaerolineaceae bacterium]